MSPIDQKLDEILRDPLNDEIRGAVEDGRIPLGYTCSLVPAPLLSTGNLFPVRVNARGVAGTEIADAYLSGVSCSFMRGLLEFAMDGRYDFLGGWVFAASCDHARRLKDNMDYLLKPGFCRVVDVPHKMSEDAVEWTADEFAGLASALAAHFGTDTSPAALELSIEAHNALVRRLRSIGEMRREPDPPFSGARFHSLIAAWQSMPGDRFTSYLDEFLETARSSPGAGPWRARVLLAGGPVDDPRYTALIESQGALVAADRHCAGSFPGLEEIHLGGDPFRRLARYALSANRCPRMMEGFRDRVDYILRTAREYAADGVIVETIKFCDTWGVESVALAGALREAGMPVLRLEREYRQSGEGQLRTRVQAFIESMGK